MSTIELSTEPRNSANQDTAHSTRLSRVGKMLLGCAAVGAGAALLLGAIEWIDVSISLIDVLPSALDRLALTGYLSVNVIGGMIIGLIVGCCAPVFSLAAGAADRILTRLTTPKAWHRLAASLFASGLLAAILNQQPSVHRYIIGLIREAEKVGFLNQPLLNHERSSSYLMLAGLVWLCSLLWIAARLSRTMRRFVRAIWFLLLGIVIAAAYYVDSRLEVQLYDHSLHLTLFWMGVAASMALVASLYFAPGLPLVKAIASALFYKFHNDPSSASKKALVKLAAFGLVLLVAFSFTLTHFGEDQNLKTQVFYRTTQTRQYFLLLQWWLDYDRDGYSAYLAGGDLDDTRSDIHPGAREFGEDGIDNNCIGGDLLEESVDNWIEEMSSPHNRRIHSARRLDVIYIFIDALRADHLSLYGYRRKTSPNIDKLGARSSVFQNAYTPSPNTFEALPKFMQSSYWDAHLETWPEILERNGYTTLLFPRRLPTLLRHVKKMAVVDEARVKTFAETIDKAIEVFGRQPVDRPFAAFLYSTDPHRPYIERGEFNFGSSLTDVYDGEIAYADSQLGRLFDWLESSGRLDKTMIVIMADHGESLGERGVYRHSTQLYNEQARVPMIIHMPGVPGRRVEDYVSTVDLGATILNAVGFEHPRECAGVSLLPLMRGEPFVHPPVYGEQTGQEVSPYVQPEQNVWPETKKYMVITQDGYKLIFNRNVYTFELYHLKSDPKEERNLYEIVDPQIATELRRLVGRYIDVLSVMRPWDADESQYRFGPVREKDE